MDRPFADEKHLVFDIANLKFLCNIAKMPQLWHSVNAYFRNHFRGKSVCLAEHDRPHDEYFTYFKRSMHQICIHGMDLDTFNYVASHFPNLSKIAFECHQYQNISVPIERADILIQQMRMVKTVVFNVDEFHGSIYERLLEHGRANIQILIVNSDQFDPEYRPDDGSQWYLQLYPYLTTLQWDEGVILKPYELQHLLANNANIHHLIFTRDISVVIDFIERHNVQLHRLDVKLSPKDLPHIEVICYRLNQLFDNGNYKQLFVTLNEDQHILHYRLSNLYGLNGITFNGEYDFAIGQCSQLTDLDIDSIGNNGWDAAQQLTALRTLCLNRASLDAITPFICAAPQIMKIVIKNFQVDSMDVRNFRYLAEQRSRLANAQKLKIFFEEGVYCILKPYEAQQSTKWIYVRRIEELRN